MARPTCARVLLLLATLSAPLATSAQIRQDHPATAALDALIRDVGARCAGDRQLPAAIENETEFQKRIDAVVRGFADPGASTALERRLTHGPYNFDRFIERDVRSLRSHEFDVRRFEDYRRRIVGGVARATRSPYLIALLLPQIPFPGGFRLTAPGDGGSERRPANYFRDLTTVRLLGGPVAGSSLPAAYLHVIRNAEMKSLPLAVFDGILLNLVEAGEIAPAQEVIETAFRKLGTEGYASAVIFPKEAAALFATHERLAGYTAGADERALFRITGNTLLRLARHELTGEKLRRQIVESLLRSPEKAPIALDPGQLLGAIDHAERHWCGSHEAGRWLELAHRSAPEMTFVQTLAAMEFGLRELTRNPSAQETIRPVMNALSQDLASTRGWPRNSHVLFHLLDLPADSPDAVRVRNAALEALLEAAQAGRLGGEFVRDMASIFAGRTDVAPGIREAMGEILFGSRELRPVVGGTFVEPTAGARVEDPKARPSERAAGKRPGEANDAKGARRPGR
jgi:hypothetical protein